MPSGIFSFLKVAPDAPRITDQEEMQQNYRYWRLCGILFCQEKSCSSNAGN